ncbi:hypothetical protein ACTA71_008235 [Dictyostelium dimigraforme]
MIEKRTYYLFLLLFLFISFLNTNAVLNQNDNDCLSNLIGKIGNQDSIDLNSDVCSAQNQYIKCVGSKIAELYLTQSNQGSVDSSDISCFSILSKLTLKDFLLSEDFLTEIKNINNVSLNLIGSTNGYKIKKKISSSIVYLTIVANQIDIDPILMSYLTDIKILDIKGITSQITFGSEISNNEEIYLGSNSISSSTRIDLSNYSKLKILNIEASIDFKISDGNFQFINVPSSLTNFKLKGSSFTNLVSAFSVLNKVPLISVSGNSISTTLPATHQLTVSPTLNVDLSNNLLTGTISQDYCSISKINFSSNKLSGAIPNCFTCFMDSTMILNFGGSSNSFTGLSVVTTNCNQIIPKLRYSSNKMYLEGTNLGFDERITSTPSLNWKMQTPSSVFVADTTGVFSDSQLFTVSFPVAKADFQIRLVPTTPVITSIKVSAAKVLTIQGTDFGNHLSLTSVKLKKVGGSDIICIIGSSTFTLVECTCSSLTFSPTDIYTLTITSNSLSKDISVRFSSAPITISSAICQNGCSSRGTCLFDGTCVCNVNAIGSACEMCIDNHYGSDCSITCPTLSGSVCNGYTCLTNNGTCSCRKNEAYGDTCQNKYCPGVNCNGNGNCNSNTGICSCNNGFYDTDCSKKRCILGSNGYECSGNVNGNCNPSTGICSCNSGYSDTDCSKKRCILGSNGIECSGNGKCNNDGTCTCNSPYYGNDCSTIPCPTFNQKTCGGNGACNSVTGICKCNSDYHEADCSKKYCPNGPNGYECSGTVSGKCNDGICSCNSPYFGNDCSSFPCPNFNQKPCGGNGVCNSTGSCKCSSDYYEADCSKKHCPNGPNGYECNGYLSGKCNNDGTCTCIPPNYGSDCSSIPCPTSNQKVCSGNGACSYSTGVCSCNTDFYGSDCSKKHCPVGSNGFECSSYLNGKCNDNGTCTCFSPFFGGDCGSIPCPTSNSDPCSGHGSCNNGVCSCSTDYYDSDCSKKRCPLGPNGFECSGNTNGKCNYQIGECQCNPDRQGIDCGISLLPCPVYLGQTCNGKQCNNQTGTCSCDPGITLPDCSGVACPQACSNGAYCDIKVGECKCGPNWSGSDCNVPIHYISSIDPCSTKGGRVILYGWFGDIHTLPSLLIGGVKCNNIFITNETVTCEMSAGTGLKDVLLIQNGVSVLGKNLFRYLNTDEPISCLNDCSGNSGGACSTTDGICNCSPEKIGFDCSARKPQDYNSSTPTPSSLSSSSENSTLEIVPISLSNIDFKTGEIVISNEDTSFTILLDSIIELDYNGDPVINTTLKNKWIGSFDPITDKYSFYQTVTGFNGKLGKIQFEAEVVKEDIKHYQFAGLNLPLDKDAIEITVNITNYQFLSGLNTLQLRFTSFANDDVVENNNNKDKPNIYDNECNQRDPEIDTKNIDPSKTLNYISIKKNSKALFGRFINIAISDSRKTFITSEVIEENTNSSSFTVGINLPHCENSCFIDPQFTLSPDYSTFKFSCEIIIVPPSRAWVVVIAVVIPVIAASVGLFFGIRYYRKNRYSIRLYTMNKSSAIKKKITLKKVNK